MPGQSTYNLGPLPGQPGQPLDNERSNQRIITAIAGVVIPFGVLCEINLTTGLAQPVQDTGTGGTYTPTLIGISLLDVFSVEQNYVPYAVPASGAGSTISGYPVGFPVPFMRRGGIWAAWDGNTGVALPKAGAIQVWHSSTGANPQGVFTTKAAQTTVGAEIDAAGVNMTVWDPEGRSGAYTDNFGNVIDVVAIEINLPGHA